jgi:hypothetical protein
VPQPTAQPEADIRLPGAHLVELVNIRQVPGVGGDDPCADYGTRVHFGILDVGGAGKFRIAARPKTGDDLPHSDFIRKKKRLFDFSEEDRGRTVCFCLRYENSKGGEHGKGPWGPIISAIIPWQENERQCNHERHEPHEQIRYRFVRFVVDFGVSHHFRS